MVYGEHNKQFKKFKIWHLYLKILYFSMPVEAGSIQSRQSMGHDWIVFEQGV